LPAKFDADRGTACDPNQAVSQHGVVLDCDEASHTQWA